MNPPRQENQGVTAVIHPTPDILEALGYPRDTLVIEQAVVPAPLLSSGHGFSSGPSSGLPHTLLSTLTRDRPMYSDVENPSFRDRIPEARIRRWDHDPAVILIELRAGGYLGGPNTLAIDEYTLLLDSRRHPAFARITGSRGEVLVGCDGGAVAAFDVEEPLSPGMEKLRAGTLLPLLELRVPEIETWGAAMPGWLSVAYSKLQEIGTPLSQVAAAGLVARLWTPPAGGDWKAALGLSLSGQGPAARVHDWARSLDAQVLDRVELLAIYQADALRSELEELSHAIAADPVGAMEDARDWVIRRDDLESICQMLRAGGQARDLGQALSSLDRDAEAHHTIWSALERPLETERLSAVAWQEPEHWWGALAG